MSSTLTLINIVLYPPLQSPCILCDSRAIYSLHSNRLWALPCNLIDFCYPPCCCLHSAVSQISTPSFHSFHSLQYISTHSNHSETCIKHPSIILALPTPFQKLPHSINHVPKHPQLYILLPTISLHHPMPHMPPLLPHQQVPSSLHLSPKLTPSGMLTLVP